MSYQYRGTRAPEVDPLPEPEPEPRPANTRPEAWHARCLRDEAEQLTIAVRMLEFQLGYSEGVNEAQIAA